MSNFFFSSGPKIIPPPPRQKNKLTTLKKHIQLPPNIKVLLHNACVGLPPKCTTSVLHKIRHKILKIRVLCSENLQYAYGCCNISLKI